MNHEALKEIILPENLQYKEARKMARLLDMGATIYYCMTGKVVPEALELRAENRIRDMRADF
ncbi:hypothetical protein [Enterocloster asparagiformis]|uniref:hypothetical protein n=1 Tax=Enterocloster asparagiformis TaxID=333367 RepID=UPI0011CB9BA2|nr:hypothetical protein [Enterocloster asparagiformis]